MRASGNEMSTTTTPFRSALIGSIGEWNVGIRLGFTVHFRNQNVNAESLFQPKTDYIGGGMKSSS
jgi:hypothetical protein